MTRNHAQELREILQKGDPSPESVHAAVIMALGFCWGWVALEKDQICPRCYREAESWLMRAAQHYGVNYG